MRNIGFNKRKLIAFISIVILLFIFVTFCYLPLAGKIKSKSMEYDRLSSQLSVIQDNSVAFLRSSVNKKIIQQQEITPIINSITQKGADLSLNFKSINQREIERIPGEYAVLFVDMEIEGSYENLGRFFGILEHLEDAVVTVEEFVIRRDETILPEVRASFVMAVYLQSS